MTVGQLKKKLESIPDHYDVFVDERKTDFRYGLVNTAEVKNIDFYESPNDDVPLAEGLPVFVLDEE